MLLYVNKKAERRKKIKLILIILFIIFFVTVNILNFQNKLHTTSENLNSYQQITHINSWYSSYHPIEIYQKNNQIKAILIPKTMTRETLETLAIILQKIKKQKTNEIHILPQLNSSELITEVLKTYNIQTNSTPTPKSIVVSSSFASLKPYIYENNLFPKIITYSNSNNVEVLSLIDKYYPLPPLPQNNLSKQKQSITLFANNHKKELKDLVTTKQTNTSNYHKKDALLKNIPICLQTKNDTFCSFNKETSLIKNIENAKKQNTSKSPYKNLILFTSFEKCSPKTFNHLNGLLFKFHNRETILLPNEITTNPFYTIKQKAGINPDYESTDMEFYQFKIVEIDINDNI